MSFLPVKKQMDLIRRGVDELIPEQDLIQKLEQ